MAEPIYTIFVTTGQRFLCKWVGGQEAGQTLYQQTYGAFGLDLRDHHWAWDGFAREIIWDIVVKGQDLTDHTRDILVVWTYYSLLENALTPIALCSFRRQFYINIAFATDVERCVWANIEPTVTLRDPPFGFVSFTLGT